MSDDLIADLKTKLTERWTPIEGDAETGMSLHIDLSPLANDQGWTSEGLMGNIEDQIAQAQRDNPGAKVAGFEFDSLILRVKWTF